LVDRRKQAKLQRLQDPSEEANEDSLSDVKWSVIRHFSNKEREYPKLKIKEHE
jgi:hypothetical protein